MATTRENQLRASLNSGRELPGMIFALGRGIMDVVPVPHQLYSRRNMNQLLHQIRRCLAVSSCVCLFLLAGSHPKIAFGQDEPVKGGSGSGDKLDKSDSRFFTVTGEVVTESGQPVSGAKLMACRLYESFDLEDRLYRSYQFVRPKHDSPVGQTDREGEFQLQFPASPASETVFAYRSGYAPSGTWASPNSPIRISLRPGTSLQGTVVDQDNRPIKSAKVRLMAWFNYEANLKALAEMRQQIKLEGDLENGVIRLETMTAGNGNFRIDDLPKDRWVVLVVSADKYLPRCVVADTGSDRALEAGVSIQRFFDGGSIRLRPATQVEFIANAKDSTKQINLQAAYASARVGMFSSGLDTEEVLKLDVRGNRAVLPVLPPGVHRFWLVPDPKLGYMGVTLDIAGDDSTTLIKKEIELVPGVRVVGRVIDAVTKKPIPGVPIHYDPESLEEFAEIGADVAPTTTDKNGDFVMIVPSINGWLRQIGNVDGYRSLQFDLNHDVRDSAPTQHISPRPGKDILVEFRLQPATRVKLKVIDSEGQPVAYARYVTKQRSSPSSFTRESGVADKLGQIELPNIFAAIFPESPDSDLSAKMPTEETIFVSSPDLQATASVQIPYPVEGQSEIKMDVVLQAASSLSGRIVDSVTGEGVEGIWINTPYDSYLEHTELGICATQSDTNGDFTLRPILPDAEFRITVYGPYIGYRPAQRDQAITIPHSTDYRHGEISIIVYRDLEKLLEVPDVSGLPPAKAFELLQAALTRARTRIAEIRSQVGGWNRRDSIAQAELTVSERFGEVFVKLSQRTEDSDLAFAMLRHLLENLDQSWGRSFYADRAKKALLERFLDREQDMVVLLPQCLDYEDMNHWQYVFDHSKNAEIKAHACYNLIVAKSEILTSMVSWNGTSEKQFDETLAILQTHLRYVFREAPDQEVHSQSVRKQVEDHLRMQLKSLESNRPTKDLANHKTLVSKLNEWLAEYAGDKE